MLRPPRFGQFSFKGGFQDRLAIPLELGLCLVECVNACVKFGEELFDLGNDTVVVQKWSRGSPTPLVTLDSCLTPISAAIGSL